VGNFKRVWRYRTTQVVRVMPDFKAVVFVEGQLPFNVANAFDAVKSAFDGQCWVMFLHNVLGRKIYPTLLRPRTFVHYSFSMISSRRARLPNRRDHGSLSQNSLECPSTAYDFTKKTLLHMVRRAHSSCAPNSIHIFESKFRGYAKTKYFVTTLDPTQI
jgi:hypothetical protein